MQGLAWASRACEGFGLIRRELILIAHYFVYLEYAGSIHMLHQICDRKLEVEDIPPKTIYGCDPQDTRQDVRESKHIVYSVCVVSVR